MLFSLLFKIYALPLPRTRQASHNPNTQGLLRWRRASSGSVVYSRSLSPTDAQARYLTWVLNYAAARVGAGPDAEDVCAETWAAAFAIWHKCPCPSHSDSADDPVRAWLCGIARRKVADVLRKRNRALPQASEVEAASAPSPAPSPELKKNTGAPMLAYLQRSYYDTAIAANQQAWGALCEIAPSGHVLFGTDYPYQDADGAEETITGVDAFPALAPAERAAINASNAHAVFGV